MEKFSIRDDNKVGRVDFVKFEITPDDGDVFNHARENWKFEVDQDFVPDWFDKEKAAAQAWAALRTVFKSRFLISDESYPSLTEGRWYVKNSLVKEIKGGTVQILSGGTVQEVLSGGTVQKVWSGGTVQKVLSGGTVQKVWSGGTVQILSGGTVQEVWSGGTVQKVLSGGTVQILSGGTVQKVLSGGTVQKVLSGGTVEKQHGGIVIYGKKICVVDKEYKIEYLDAPHPQRED